MLGLNRRTTADDVRRVAIAALATALDDGKQEAREKPGLTGVRAVATGAVLYTGARAAFASRRFIRDRLGSDGSEASADEGGDDDAEYEDEPEAEYEDEPEAEVDEDEPEAEYEDEPEAEADEDEPYEDEPEAEAEVDEEEASEDDTYEDEDSENEAVAEDEDEAPEGAASSRRPPVHSDRDPEDDDADLPQRPSRSRAPVGRS